MERYFAYCRKSTEAEDRQVLSIQSQTTELETLAALNDGIIGRAFSEAKSAKGPGRPQFNEMMRLAETRQCNAILCWKLDRLARNPIDAGRVIWAVKEFKVKIITPNRTYDEHSDSTAMYLEFGIAQKYIEDLSDNVKRGLKTKAVELGWKPARAPIGYLNRSRWYGGFATIPEDPERFHLVERLWRTLLTRQYSVPTILDIATNEWGLTSRPSRKRSSKPLSLSGLYNLFSTRFYYGVYEYPRGSGCFYKGAHKPMITKAEFDGAQMILGRTDRTRTQKRDFAFTGLMRCATCNAMITAEEKHKRQENGNTHHYIYYHCTKRTKPRCPEDYQEEKHLIVQIRSFLASLDISPLFLEWALIYIDELRDAEGQNQAEEKKGLEKRVSQISTSLQELTKMRYHKLIDDAEFERERSALKLEQEELENNLQRLTHNAGRWREPTKHCYRLLASLVERFTNGSPAMKKGILSDVSSNLRMKGKTFIPEAKKVLVLIQERYKQAMAQLRWFEPNENGLTAMQKCCLNEARLLWCTSVHDVRTYFMKMDEKRLNNNDHDSNSTDVSLYRTRLDEIDKAA